MQTVLGRTRLWVGTVTTVAVIGAALAVAGPAAAATAPRGVAVAGFFSIGGPFVEVGRVDLPPGGTFTAASAMFGGLGTLTTVSSSTTLAPDGGAQSSTSIQTADLLLVGVPVVATAISASCTAGDAGVSATSSVGSLTIGGVAITLPLAGTSTTTTIGTATVTVAAGFQTNPNFSPTTDLEILRQALEVTVSVDGQGAVTIVLGEVYCAATASPVSAVTLRGLSATPARTGVVVRWNTASETGTLGFNVYRELNGKRVRVNPKLIAVNAVGRYSLIDRKAPKGKTVRYWIQAVNLDGSRKWYGPTRVARTT